METHLLLRMKQTFLSFLFVNAYLFVYENRFSFRRIGLDVSLYDKLASDSGAPSASASTFASASRALGLKHVPPHLSPNYYFLN